MKIKVIRTVEDLIKIKDFWEKIEKTNLEVPYINYEFVKNWIEKVFEKKDELFIITIINNEKVVAIAPLFIEKRKIKFIEIKELKFIGNGDYKNFLIDRNNISNEKAFKYIMDYIYENINLFDRVILEKINGKSEFSNYILKDDKYNNLFKYYNEVPILYLKDIRLGLKKLMKPSKLNKYKNKLSNEYNYIFEVKKCIDIELFLEIIQIHKAQQDYLNEVNNYNKRRSIFYLNKLDDFYSHYIVNNNNIVLFTLRSRDREIINYRICYLFDNILYSWNTGYNIKFKEYRVNNILFSEIFQYLLNETEIELFDFGAGRYPWKFTWTKDFNIVYNFEDWNIKNFKNKILRKIMNIKKNI